MREPYEEYFRYVRRRHRAQVATVVGAVVMMLAVISAVVVAWQVSAEDQRIAAALEVPPTPR
jgi:hypothetical protein